jgi:hypothetical protein
MASGESAACAGVQHGWRWVELEAEEEEQGAMASGESVACGMAGQAEEEQGAMASGDLLHQWQWR